jgi:hypothetical protein
MGVVPLVWRRARARALGWADIQKFIENAGEGLPATRERALLCVAYDTMARRAELVAFNRGDIRFLEDGSGRALIRRSKTDQLGASDGPASEGVAGTGGDHQRSGVPAADRHRVHAQEAATAGSGRRRICWR